MAQEKSASDEISECMVLLENIAASVHPIPDETENELLPNYEEDPIYLTVSDHDEYTYFSSPDYCSCSGTSSSCSTFSCDDSNCTCTSSCEDCSCMSSGEESEGPAIQYKTTTRSLRGQESVYKCVKCTYFSKRKKTVMKHFKRIHLKVFQCGLCNFKSSYEHEFYFHMKSHFNGPPYTCAQCPFRSFNLKPIVTHLSTHSKVKEFKCNKCKFVGKTAKALRRHKLLHNKEGKFKCARCGRSYKTIKGLRKHIDNFVHESLG